MRASSLLLRSCLFTAVALAASAAACSSDPDRVTDDSSSSGGTESSSSSGSSGSDDDGSSSGRSSSGGRSSSSGGRSSSSSASSSSSGEVASSSSSSGGSSSSGSSSGGPADWIDGGTNCNSVPSGTYVSWNGFREYAPGTDDWAGGEIPDGRYVLASYLEYNGPSGAGGTQQGGEDGQGILVVGSSWYRSYRITGGSPAKYDNLQFTSTGASYTLTRTCQSPNAPALKGGATHRYRLTASGFELYDGGTGASAIGSFSRYTKL